jgi:hypothetical protein
MTFDGPINTTYGEAVAQIRDKISGMADWSAKDENYETDDTAFSGSNDYFVLTTPEGSDVRIAATGSNELRLEHGPEWDTGASSWADKYSKDWRAMPKNGDDYTDGNFSDQVRWWVEYVNDKGFAFAMTREEGDNDDRAMAMGFSELTRLWDYTTAQVRESKYTALVVGYGEANYGDEINIINGTFEGATSNGTYDGKGQVNADGNNDNFPLVETTLQASSKYEDALIGEHDLWILDNSGSRSAHLDTVTDGGGDLFTLFTEDMVTPVGIRME